jgi:hypothetical protein
MREQLNNNPRVQMIVIGVMVLLGVFLLFTTVLKKSPAPPDDGLTPAEKAAEKAGIATPSADPAAAAATGTTTPPADTGATDPAATADPSAATPSTPTAPAPAPDTSAAAADGLLPTKGLPKDVLIAFAKDKTIALLVFDPKATTDKQIKQYTEALASDKVEVFEVEAEDVAKYSRITSGVSVSRTPALVVIRPRSATDNVPTATVSYGFRDEKSVQQAFKDARYQGKVLPAYP